MCIRDSIKIVALMCSYNQIQSYIIGFWSFLALRKKEPDLKRPWRCPAGTFGAWFSIVCFALLLILAYDPVAILSLIHIYLYFLLRAHSHGIKDSRLIHQIIFKIYIFHTFECSRHTIYFFMRMVCNRKPSYRFRAVSYTHLDVYKRQVLANSFILSTSTPFIPATLLRLKSLVTTLPFII